MTGTETRPDENRERETSPSTEFLVRAGSAVVLTAIALAAVVVSPWTFLALAVYAGAILAWEWGNVVRGNGLDAIAGLQALGVAAVAVLAALGRLDLAFAALSAAAVAMALAGLAASRPGWSVAGLLYTALPIGAVVWLRSDKTFGVSAVLYVFIVAWITDTLSYAAGRLIGGPKLAPSISPHKTWSGMIAGTLAPALVGCAFAVIIGGTSVWYLALIGVILGLACQIGDLVESAVKRHFGVKDMSALIPGHGGLFDRIDGLLFAALLAGLIALRDPESPGRGLLIW